MHDLTADDQNHDFCRLLVIFIYGFVRETYTKCVILVNGICMSMYICIHVCDTTMIHRVFGMRSCRICSINGMIGVPLFL